MNKVLEVNGLSVIYGRGCPLCLKTTGPEHDTNRCSRCGSIVAIQNISFDLFEGDILGVMGESGSGKSTIVKSLYFDEEASAGTSHFFDRDEQSSLFELNAAQRRDLRYRRFGMVYQNPNLGLNFGISAGGNIAERLLMNGMLVYADIRSRANELLQRTEVPTDRIDELPSNFSGGMQQRVQIAKALATNPPLLFLEEVTTGLDVSVQASILDLIIELQDQLQTTMIVVTHDLGVIRLLAGRTIVMKNGCIIERGLTDQILEDPQQAYTQRLVSAAL